MKALNAVFWKKLASRPIWRTLVLALLLVLLAQVLARTIWVVLAGPLEPVALAPGMTVVQVTEQHQVAGLNQATVASWSLFGVPKKVASPSGEDAPETRLNLTLLGVFAQTDSKMAGAIIQANSRDSKLYHPGDELPGRATLYKVYPDKVLLKRMGVVEALSFENNKLGGSVKATKKVVPPPSSSVQQQRSMVINQLALAPVKPGYASGYKVTKGIAPTIQNAVGLKPGDVILSVNGLPIGTGQADQAAIQSFYDRGKASVRIKRGGSQITLVYPP